MIGAFGEPEAVAERSPHAAFEPAPDSRAERPMPRPGMMEGMDDMDARPLGRETGVRVPAGLEAVIGKAGKRNR